MTKNAACTNVPLKGAGSLRLGRAAGRGYFFIQALAGAVWWCSVFLFEPVRHSTLGELDPLLIAALDLPLFVLASALVALGQRWAVWIVVPWTGIVAVGMVAYATATQLAGWGAVLMTGAFAAGVVAGLLVLFDRLPGEALLIGPLAIQKAKPRSRARNLSATCVQIFVFWGVFLLVLPLGIAWLERRWGLRLEGPPVAEALVAVIGLALLVAASALGMWSAHAMASLGHGTPLPSAAANQLVIAGPYRFVRNPMAVAGIAQGVAVGLMLGSWLVVTYALCGSIIWNWAVRPHEEADLEERFGAEFLSYRDRVSCWVPRL